MDRAIATTLILLIAIPLVAQRTGNITVELKDIKSPEDRPIYLMQFDTEEGFPREIDFARLVAKLETSENQLSYQFENLPYGTYAISMFQDRNANQEIDSNFLGFPKEPIGATNMDRLGKPFFDKCQIKLDQQEVNTQIKFLIN